MAENQKPFQPTSVAVLNNGKEIVPESKKEEQFLTELDKKPYTDEEKARIAQLGTLFNGDDFDDNFTTDKRKTYPTDLDPQLRKMIRASV